MTKKDWELLDKQLQRFGPPRDNGTVYFPVIAVVFLAGVVLGGVLLPYLYEQTKTMPGEVGAVSFLESARANMAQ